MKQYPDLAEETKVYEVHAKAEFVAIFYAVWFLSSPMTSQSPFNDILAYWQMKKYKENSQSKTSEGAERVLESIEHHSWYVEEDMIPLALIDPTLPDFEKEFIAKKLLETPVPQSFPPRNRKNLPKMNEKADFSLTFPPSISEFIGPYSWLIFDMLGFLDDEDKYVWLSMKPKNWPKVDDFKRFEAFVSKLPVVNDTSERSVQLIADYVNNVHNEDMRQDLLLSTAEYRSSMRDKFSKKAMSDAHKKTCFFK